MRQQDDWLLGMVDALARQIWLIVDDQCDAIRTRNVGGSDDGELVTRHTGLIADASDEAPCHGAADGGAKHHSRQRHIVDIPRAAGDFRLSLFSRNRSSQRLRHWREGSTT